MFEDLKKCRMREKMILEPFYLEKRYQKIAKEKFVSSKKRIEKMAELFYWYFEDAYDEYMRTAEASYELVTNFLDGGREEDKKAYLANERIEHVLFRLKEIAPYLEDCDSVHLQAMDCLDEYCKALCDVAYYALRNNDKKLDYEYLKTNVLDKHKEAEEEKSAAK